jgi:hypothetical protein
MHPNREYVVGCGWFPCGGLVRFVSGCNAVGFSGELDMAFLNAKAEFNDLNDPIFIYTVNLV